MKSLVINETALQTFVFEVEQCELVTWDGTIIRFQAEPFPSNARIVPRAFEKALDPGGKPLGVYLGLKRLRQDDSNIEALVDVANNSVEAETSRRFRLREVETPDFLAGDGQSCTLEYLVHDIKILFEGDVTIHTQDYELIKIAELLRATDGPGAVLSKRYIPTTSLACFDQICPWRIAVLRSQATRESGFLPVRKPLCEKACAYKCRCGVNTLIDSSLKHTLTLGY